MKLAAALALALVATPVLAVEDAATGLKVDLPGDFAIEASQRSNYQALFGVSPLSGQPSSAGSPYLCEVGFQAAPSNQGMTQDQINKAMSEPSWSQMAQAGLEPAFTINSEQDFALNGVGGLEFIATPKAGPEALNVRVFLSFMETPKGRTVVSCATTAPEIDGALPVFRAIRQGVTPPA